ncbi:MAG: FAD-dependent thymidylate synthase, partial [candidate division WOR-3 bacterium]
MKEYKVLDKGFVRLIDFLGGDNAVVQAARVSHGEGLKGEEKDKKLIRYLLKNQHLTPFEHSVF